MLKTGLYLFIFVMPDVRKNMNNMFIVCCMSCNLFLYSACMYVLCYEPRLNKSVFKIFYLNVVFIKLLL